MWDPAFSEGKGNVQSGWACRTVDCGPVPSQAHYCGVEQGEIQFATEPMHGSAAQLVLFVSNHGGESLVDYSGCGTHDTRCREHQW